MGHLPQAIPASSLGRLRTRIQPAFYFHALYSCSDLWFLMERSLSEARRGAVTYMELMHFRVLKKRTCLCSPPRPGDDTHGLTSCSPRCRGVSKLCWVLHICTWGKRAALGLSTRPHLLGCRGLSPRADSTEGAGDSAVLSMLFHAWLSA